MNTKRILVIDDEKNVAKMFSRRLKRAGYVVEIAHDGATGIELALENLPDLIILDIQMPSMNGYEVIGQLRELGYSGLVTACSASVTEKDSQRSIEAGCDHFISKPIGLDFEDQIFNLLNPA